MPRQADPSTVLIFEPDHRGHRLNYARMIADEALERGRSVVLATSSEGRHSQEWVTRIHEIESSLVLVDARENSLEEAEKLARSVKADHSILPSGDQHLAKLARRGWRGTGSASVLIMRMNATESGRVDKRLIRWAGKRLLVILANLRRSVSVLALRSVVMKRPLLYPTVQDPVTLMPPTTASVAWARTLGMDSQTRWVAVLGALTSRKNIPLVTSALRNAREADIGFVLAGQIAEEIRDDLVESLNALREANIKVVSVERALSEVELDTLIHLSAVLVLAHSNEGPSGLMGKAAKAGTRIVAAGAKSLRSDCKRMKNMSSWANLNSHDISAAISVALSLQRPDAMTMPGPSEFAKALS